MASDPLDEDTQLAIQMSLESFKLENLAPPGAFPDDPVIAVQEVFPSSPNLSSDYSSNNDSAPAVFDLGGHIQGQKEILIAVMGAAGTGKTTFINLVAGRDVGKVGRGLRFGTGEVCSYPVSYGGHNFTLIDTPGFDDCHHSDAEILRKISDWLVQSYRDKRKITAILYFTRMSDPRMQGSPLTNFKMFKELCGEKSFGNIVLGTTFWGVMDSKHPGSAERREKELVEEFWGDMIERGSEVIRIPENRWLARELLVRLAKKTEISLKNQQERVEQNKAFESTAANSALNAETERLKAKYESEITEWQMRMEKDREEREKELKKEVEARTAEHNKRLEEQRKQQKQMEAERLQQEKESQRLRDDARKERERVEKEQAELAEQVKKMAKEREIQERRRKGLEFARKINTCMAEIKRAKEADKILANFQEPKLAYMIYCDNCFRSIGANVYYQCDDPLCANTDEDDGNFVLCTECHAAPGVYCNDASHYTSMKKLEQTDTQNQCTRIVNPPKPGARLACDRCGNNTGALYFHCCFCCDDNYDLCVHCVTTYQTCKKPWSISGHPLDVCIRYPDVP